MGGMRGVMEVYGWGRGGVAVGKWGWGGVGGALARDCA